MDGRGMQTAVKGLIKFFRVIYKSTTGTTQRIRRADNERESNVLGYFLSLKKGSSCTSHTNAYTQFQHFQAEFFAVFGSLDGFNINANDPHTEVLPDAGLIAFNAKIQGGLPSHGW